MARSAPTEPIFSLLRLRRIVWIDPSSRLMNGYGQLGGHMHHGGGVAFVGKLMALGLGAIVLLVFISLAMPSITRWLSGRYRRRDFDRRAGSGALVVVGVVVAFGLLLALAHFL